jgi:hypothetical protein
VEESVYKKYSFFHWPEKVLGPRPGLRELNVLCWGLFVLLILVPAAIFFHARNVSGKVFRDFLPVDFIYYYGDGRLVKDYPPGALYDHDTQMKVFKEIYPETYSVSPYPPLVGEIFSLYARLPLEGAYFLWFGTSLLLYIAGITAGLKAAFPGEPLKHSLGLCFALTFPPFLGFNLVPGQLSSVAAFAVGCALFLERRSRPFASGLALSILSYKPILLVLILPMLLLTRRFRTLWGYLSGTAALIAISTALSGPGIWIAYAGLIRIWLHGAGVHGKAVYKHWTLVDLNSLSYGISGGRSTVGLAVLACLMLAIATWGATLLWRSAKFVGSSQYLAWAVTLTWTLLLNLYVPIYDTVLVVLAVMLTLGALSELDWGGAAAAAVVILGLCIFVVSVFTQTYAEKHGFQPITALLFGLGLLQAALLERAIKRSAARHNGEMLSTTTTPIGYSSVSY